MGWYVSRARATWWIVGITVAAHVALVLISGQNPELGKKIVEKCWASTEGWHDFELWRSFTYLLIHAGTSHILWNMLFLGVAGSLLEPQIGPRAFLRIYIASGLVGSVSTLFHGHPTVGASGAINGTLVALAVLMPDVIVLFMFLLPMKIKWVVTIFLGIDLLNVLGSENRGTDSICHLLGAATGFSIAWIGPRLVKPWWTRRRAEKAREEHREKVEREVDEERELDRVLEKISREGMTSLTEAERRFLKTVSGKYQNSRRD